MDGINPKIWNSLLTGNNIAQEIDSIDKLNRKWVAIYQSDNKKYMYRVFLIELPKEILDNNYDWSEDEEISEELYFKNEDELFLYLKNEEIDCGKFTSPWKCEYPY